MAATMERETLFEHVDDRTETSTDDAANATRAVLETLGERVSEDQAGDLAAQPPEELGTHLTDGESRRRFSEEEFVSRVDQRIETTELGGERATTAVLGTVLEGVDESERAAVVDQFEHYGFEDLLGDIDTEVDVTDRTPREL